MAESTEKYKELLEYLNRNEEEEYYKNVKIRLYMFVKTTIGYIRYIMPLVKEIEKFWIIIFHLS